MATVAKIEAQLAKLDLETHNKREALYRELEIVKLLPDVGAEWSVFSRRFRSSVATVTLRKSISYNAKQISVEEFMTAATELPGLPMVKVKGAFTSHLVEDDLKYYGNEDDIKSQEPLAPWIVEGGRHRQGVDIVWYTRLADIGIVKVTVEMPWMQCLHYAVTATPKRGYTAYENWKIVTDRNKLFTIYGMDESTPVAELGPSTKFASGSHDEAGQAVQAWTPLDDPCKATVYDFARALKRAIK